MIKYTRLFDLLKERGMKKTDLLAVISSPTLAKLGKNEGVTMETIDKLCIFLGVQIDSVLEFIPPDSLKPEISTLKKRRKPSKARAAGKPGKAKESRQPKPEVRQNQSSRKLPESLKQPETCQNPG